MQSDGTARCALEVVLRHLSARLMLPSQPASDSLTGCCVPSAVLGAGETAGNITNLVQGELDRNQISKDEDIRVYFLLRAKTKQGMVIESQEAAVRVIREDFWRW